MQSSILCIATLLLGDAICSNKKCSSIHTHGSGKWAPGRWVFKGAIFYFHNYGRKSNGSNPPTSHPPIAIFDAPTSTSPAKFEGRRKGDIRIPPLASHGMGRGDGGKPTGSPGCCQSQQRWTRDPGKAVIHFCRIFFKKMGYCRIILWLLRDISNQ